MSSGGIVLLIWLYLVFGREDFGRCAGIMRRHHFTIIRAWRLSYRREMKPVLFRLVSHRAWRRSIPASSGSFSSTITAQMGPPISHAGNRGGSLLCRQSRCLWAPSTTWSICTRGARAKHVDFMRFGPQSEPTTRHVSLSRHIACILPPICGPPARRDPRF